MNEKEILVEAALTAARTADRAGQIYPHPVWADLGREERLLLFEKTVEARTIEAALDSNGLSPTIRAVLKNLQS